MDPALPGIRKTLVVAIGVATLVGLLFSAQVWLVRDVLDVMPPEPLWRTTLGQMVPWWSWALIVGVLFWWFERVGLHRAGMRRLLSVHISAAVVVALVQAVAMGVIEATLHLWDVGGGFVDSVATFLVYRVVTNLLLYAFAATAFHAVAYVAELRRSREALEEAQAKRVRAVRSLSGGLSHEMNNALAIVELASSEMARLLPGEHPALAELENLRRAYGKLRELGGRLQALGEGLMLHARPVAVREFMSLVSERIEQWTGLEAEVALAGGSGGDDQLHIDPHVLADTLGSVLLELDGDGRQPRGVRFVDLGWSVDAAGDGSSVDGRSTRARTLEIRVDGVTPPPDPRDLFEPRFSTQGPRVGPNLAAAAARGLVSQMSGRLDARVEGQGVTLRLELPGAPRSPVRR